MQKSDCIIGVEHVSKFFGDKAVLNDVNLSVRKGEFVTILGPSGCGKTTLLRLIAGFQTASEGVITIAGKDITQTPPHKRPVNTVFQKYALFPHLNVFNNIAFGLKLKKLPGATIEKKVKQALRTVSGMRPTGPLHLGHYFGVLKNWVELQHTEEAYFFVADWHALTSDYADPSNIATNVEEMVKDWVAAGLDPEKCVIFRQSAVKEHAELSLLLSMITPVSWLERNPTYKEQQQQITNKDLGNAGFLCYPVLMAADILMYRPHGVPVGEDQLPHMELTREIARRFNYLYGGNFFPEPQAMLTPAAKCPGLDGRKMSKSYNNGIFLRDTMADIEPKVRGMFTDPARLRKSDPGNPDVCNLFPYHVLLASPEEQAEIRTGCTGASFGCVECKKRFLKNLEAFLAPLQERRAALSARPGAVAEILAAGNERARAFASATLAEVRAKMGL